MDSFRFCFFFTGTRSASWTRSLRSGGSWASSHIFFRFSSSSDSIVSSSCYPNTCEVHQSKVFFRSNMRTIFVFTDIPEGRGRPTTILN